MDELRRQFKADLLTKRPTLVASLWVMEGVPYIFGDDKEAYANWRELISDGIGVDSSEIQIIGSAATGISLNPHKNYRAFCSTSDVDIAIISEHFFNVSWRFLRGLGPRLHSFPPSAKQSVHNHVSKYIYWGTIATDRLLGYLPFGHGWLEVFEEAAKKPPVDGRPISARIYKDFDSLRSYHVRNLKFLRDSELQ